MRIRYLLPTLAIGFALYAFNGYAQDKPPTSPPIAQVPGTVPAAGKESTPAVVTTTIPSPASPTHVPEQVMWALAMSYVMQFLKKQKWFPLLTESSAANVQAFFGFLVATATAAGIHVAVSGNMLDSQGVAFSITGLSADAIKDIGFQWVAQQGWYDALVKSRTVAPVLPNT